jgi:hypothetical protein
MFDVVVRRMLSLGLPLVLLGGCTEVVQADDGGGGSGGSQTGGAPAGGAPSTGGNSNGGAPEGGAEPVSGGGGMMGPGPGPGGGMNEGGGMMGPHPCDNQDDCEGNCPPQSIGCSCENTPMGMYCIPTCKTAEDCPPGPMGSELTCNPDGICVPEMPNP